jgi:uncharacterized protein
MHFIIDRRLNPKHKSVINRERFLRRYRAKVKDAVARSVRSRSITNTSDGEDVHLPRKDIAEPSFRHGGGGVWESVHPGNVDFVPGDRIPRPLGGAGQSSGDGAGDGSGGEDDFVFTLTKEEFLNYLFEDLELPDLVKLHLTAPRTFERVRAGYVSDGTPANLHIVRSMKGAIGRRIALAGPMLARLRELEAELAELRRAPEDNGRAILALDEQVHQLKRRLLGIPFIDPFDLRFVNRSLRPKPSNQAVMFCLMDVSGSMDEARKDMAKRFFILLYLFLERVYEKIDVVFIRHHTQAEEVDEETFFRSRESGGTVVSSALLLMQEVIAKRYPVEEWNIYGAQASDGDNWDNDSVQCRELLSTRLLPLCQYFAYVEIGDRPPQSLWQEYAAIGPGLRQFAMQRIRHPGEIYPVFRELFRRQQRAVQ